MFPARFRVSSISSPHAHSEVAMPARCPGRAGLRRVYAKTGSGKPRQPKTGCTRCVFCLDFDDIQELLKEPKARAAIKATLCGWLRQGRKQLLKHTFRHSSIRDWEFESWGEEFWELVDTDDEIEDQIARIRFPLSGRRMKRGGAKWMYRLYGRALP